METSRGRRDAARRGESGSSSWCSVVTELRGIDIRSKAKARQVCGKVQLSANNKRAGGQRGVQEEAGADGRLGQRDALPRGVDRTDRTHRHARLQTAVSICASASRAVRAASEVAVGGRTSGGGDATFLPRSGERVRASMALCLSMLRLLSRDDMLRPAGDEERSPIFAAAGVQDADRQAGICFQRQVHGR